jgi:Predicted metal-dependent hydrolase with the TIM-barrel fold
VTSILSISMHAIGWNQDLFEDSDRMPDRHDLDKISTEIPIVLERVCGHIVSSNTKAIEKLGIDGNSPQYPGGTFHIGEDGYPNGVFDENACNYIKDVIPDFSLEERRVMLGESMKYAVAHDDQRWRTCLRSERWAGCKCLRCILLESQDFY